MTYHIFGPDLYLEKTIFHLIWHKIEWLESQKEKKSQISMNNLIITYY